MFATPLKTLSTVSLIALCASQAQALTVTPTDSAMTLAQTLFLNAPGVTVLGATLPSGVFATSSSADPSQVGTYANASGTYGLPTNGIVLSTGNVRDYGDGPNNDQGWTTDYTGTTTAADQPQQDLLFPITGKDAHFDAVQLDISFLTDIAIASVTFFAAFGSDEFPEWVNTAFNDGFGLYVNGTNVASAIQTGGGSALPINIDHPDMAAMPGTELDGMLAPNGNPVLRFDVPVLSGAENRFQIILADASDGVLDTTIYLSSFFATPGGSGSGGEDGPGSGATGGDGASEFFPLLPTSYYPNSETGSYEVELPEGSSPDTVWVDPPVTVGYTYDLPSGFFTSVSAPSLATVADLDGYTLSTAWGSTLLLPAQTIELESVFGDHVFDTFTISGIDPGLALDPNNPLAFPFGIQYEELLAGDLLSITPINESSVSAVPLPASGLLLLGSLLAGMLRRRRRV